MTPYYNAVHATLLRILAECPPGTGRPIHEPGRVARCAFNECSSNGWVEEVVVGPLIVWKITDQGREELLLLIASQTIPIEE